jgi:hypothetical protein
MPLLTPFLGPHCARSPRKWGRRGGWGNGPWLLTACGRCGWAERSREPLGRRARAARQQELECKDQGVLSARLSAREAAGAGVRPEDTLGTGTGRFNENERENTQNARRLEGTTLTPVHVSGAELQCPGVQCVGGGAVPGWTCQRTRRPCTRHAHPAPRAWRYIDIGRCSAGRAQSTNDERALGAGRWAAIECRVLRVQFGPRHANAN